MELGIQDIRVKECMKRFSSLCERAFVPKTGARFSIVARSIRHTKYRTEPLVEELKTLFNPHNPIFGKRSSSGKYGCKVAVTSTTQSPSETVIFTNYNRNTEADTKYIFERSNTQESEPRLSEVAQAAMASPMSFKPYRNDRNNKHYADATIFVSNPTMIADSERKLIWQENEALQPDIMLSIGTGQFRETKGQYDVPSVDPSSIQHPTGRGVSNSSRFPLVYDTVRAMGGEVENLLQAEETWRRYRKHFGTDR